MSIIKQLKVTPGRGREITGQGMDARLVNGHFPNPVLHGLLVRLARKPLNSIFPLVHSHIPHSKFTFLAMIVKRCDNVLFVLFYFRACFVYHIMRVRAFFPRPHKGTQQPKTYHPYGIFLYTHYICLWLFGYF